MDIQLCDNQYEYDTVQNKVVSKIIILIYPSLIKPLLYDRQLHYRVVGYSPRSTELYTSNDFFLCLGFEMKRKQSKENVLKNLVKYLTQWFQQGSAMMSGRRHTPSDNLFQILTLPCTSALTLDDQFHSLCYLMCELGIILIIKLTQ